MMPPQALIEDLSHAITHRNEVYAIHYACESFFTAIDHPTGISAISVSTVPTRTDATFSVKDYGEQDAELRAMAAFYQWLRSHRDARIVHWNMSKSEYGFDAIAKRFTYLGGSDPQFHPEDRLYDLDELLQYTHGRGYAPNPRLASLAAVNELEARYLLTGQEQAERYEVGDHASLSLSTSERARWIAELAVRFVTDSLQLPPVPQEPDSDQDSPASSPRTSGETAADRVVVFISHIGAEATIAHELKAALETVFSTRIAVFVSSEPESIPAGSNWMERITDALRTCAVLVVLASPAAIVRPWINFESGAGWIRDDATVIPACHSGMTPGSLPAPLGLLQSVRLTDGGDLENQLFAAIARLVRDRGDAYDYGGLEGRLSQLTSELMPDLGVGDDTAPTPTPPASAIVVFDEGWLAQQRANATADITGESA